MWLTKEFAALADRHRTVRLDYCEFGEPWLKPTLLLYSKLLDLGSVGRQCGFRTNHFYCTATGKRHLALVGRDETGVWMTHRAQPYPKQFVRELAKIFKAHLASSASPGPEDQG